MVWFLLKAAQSAQLYENCNMTHSSFHLFSNHFTLLMTFIEHDLSSVLFIMKSFYSSCDIHKVTPFHFCHFTKTSNIKLTNGRVMEIQHTTDDITSWPILAICLCPHVPFASLQQVKFFLYHHIIVMEIMKRVLITYQYINRLSCFRVQQHLHKPEIPNHKWCIIQKLEHQPQ